MKQAKVPAWFSLSNYEASKNFTELEWFVNFEWRYRFFRLLDKRRTIEQWSDVERLKAINLMECNKDLQHIIEKITCQPIISPADDGQIAFYTGDTHLPYQDKEKNVQTMLNSDM